MLTILAISILFCQDGAVLAMLVVRDASGARVAWNGKIAGRILDCSLVEMGPE